MSNAAQLADFMLQGRVGDLQSIMPQYPGRAGATSIAPQYPGYGVGYPVEQQAQPVQQPVRYTEAQYLAADVSYLGFGSTSIGAGATVTVNIPTNRPFRPQKLGFPSTTVGLLVQQVNISGTNVFANQQGVPVVMLSEVSTFPQINFPDLDTATGVDFTVFNTTAGALPFQGAFYGTQLRR